MPDIAPLVCHVGALDMSQAPLFFMLLRHGLNQTGCSRSSSADECRRLFKADLW